MGIAAIIKRRTLFKVITVVTIIIIDNHNFKSGNDVN